MTASSSSSGADTGIISSSSPPISMLGGNLNQTISVKLDRNNFLIWKFIVLPVIKGHRLEDHLLGTSACPQKFLPTGDKENDQNVQLNPAYGEWTTKNQLLMGWLLGTMTEQILIEVVGCTTADEIWETLEMAYNNQFESQMLEYKTALTKSEKVMKNMSDYLMEMKAYSDKLAAAAYPISRSELILATLGGLGKDYEAVIVNLTPRIGSLTWPEVQAQLITHERLIARFTPTVNRDIHSPSANIENSNRPPSSTNGSGILPRPNFSPNYRGRASFNLRGGRFRGRCGRFGYGRPVCQLCGKLGHVVSACYHRFDPNFTTTGRPAIED